MALAPEFKAKWVAALRSGEYKQTNSTLKDRDGYCCLGVLCHLFSEDIAKAVTAYTETDTSIVIEWSEEVAHEWRDEEESELPPPVLKAIGLKPEDQTKLITMNDGRRAGDEFVGGKSFAEIADHIEANL